MRIYVIGGGVRLRSPGKRACGREYGIRLAERFSLDKTVQRLFRPLEGNARLSGQMLHVLYPLQSQLLFGARLRGIFQGTPFSAASLASERGNNPHELTSIPHPRTE